jgi:CDP-diglyceride synthetase
VWTVLWVLLVTKSCDIGAYFTGRAIGRHKLIPWLSPGKTWEGLVGGVALSALVAWGINQVFTAYLAPGTVALAFGICVGVGVVFGFVPAWRAASARPIEALRYE